MNLYTCRLCGETVKETDLRAHLVEHAPAFGSSDATFADVLRQFTPVADPRSR